MREILFRGKRIDSGKWVQGFYIHHRNVAHYIIDIQHGGYEDIDGGFFVPRWYAVDPKTIGQYTGLTDKNGKRIFEGDILRYKNETCWVINWCAEETRFIVTGYIDGKKCEHICIDTVFRDFEAIGNIHDNPKLLEGG